MLKCVLNASVPSFFPEAFNIPLWKETLWGKGMEELSNEFLQMFGETSQNKVLLSAEKKKKSYTLIYAVIYAP